MHIIKKMHMHIIKKLNTSISYYMKKDGQEV